MKERLPRRLLEEQELIWSPVVANVAMNRSRNASGVNSYEQELGFRPEMLLLEKIKAQGMVRWLDLCCGEGRALYQASAYLQGQQQREKATLVGVDLIDLPGTDDPFPPRFIIASVAGWQPDQEYDLITCIHGLHYVGDKLGVLEKMLPALAENGMLMAHLDLQNIQLDQDNGADYLKAVFKKQGISFKSRSRMLVCEGRHTLNFGLNYFGADDRSGPNYTGQEAVTSYYSRKPK